MQHAYQLRCISADQTAILLQVLPTQLTAGMSYLSLRVGYPIHGRGLHQQARQQIWTICFLAQRLQNHLVLQLKPVVLAHQLFHILRIAKQLRSQHLRIRNRRHRRIHLRRSRSHITTCNGLKGLMK